MAIAAPRFILVVEDERIVAEDICQTLAGLGYSATAEGSGEKALGIAAERQPDLALLDIRIRGSMDGIDLATQLRERYDTPIVFLTAHADETTLARAATVGPLGYLVKPIKTIDLRVMIEVSLHRAVLERRLRERERWNATTLDSLADAVVTLDAAGHVSYMNRAAQTLIGAEPEQVRGTALVDCVPWLVPEGTLPAWDMAARTGQAIRVPERDVYTGRGVRTIALDVAPVMDGRNMLGMAVVLRDATAEATMRRHVAIIDQLGSIGALAAEVAHEINNPLAVVVSNSRYIARYLAQHRELLSAGERQAESFGEVEGVLSDLQSSATRIEKAVVGMRQSTRKLAGDEQICDVAAAIDWAVRNVAPEVANRARLGVTRSDVPWVIGQEVPLGHVFLNLLLNAAHSIEPGRPDANAISVRSLIDTEGCVCVEIRDTGCGSPRDVLPRIYEPFFTTQPTGHGTGLGLSTSLATLRTYGARLSIDSEVGSGTLVRVVLRPAEPIGPGAENFGRGEAVSGAHEGSAAQKQSRS